jgi:hypothetical protein
MPQRFLKPGLTHSKRFNQVSWFSQALFVRLITLVDDFGRFESDPVLLTSLAFPRGGPASEPVDPVTVQLALRQLVDVDLILLYRVADTSYLQLNRWVERHRSASRFPAPDTLTTNVSSLTTSDNKCQQPAGNCCQLTAPPTPTSASTSTPAIERENGSARVIPDPNGAKIAAPSGTPSMAAIRASQTRWGALNQQIKDLEGKGDDRTVEECRLLAEKKREQKAIQAAQARGEFS